MVYAKLYIFLIQYMCFDVSQKFIVFGANSGGLYIFNREPFYYSQLIPTTEGQIKMVRISANEKFIAFVTKKNIICTVELNEYSFGKLFTRSEDFSDSVITALEWSTIGNTLFIGGWDGTLSMLKLPFLNNPIFALPTYTLMKFDSKIVQISYHNDMLLVSTLTRCFICDTVKEYYKQIGEKLRNGEYGACFLNLKNNNYKIFCARPGSRLWEVNSDGLVHSTQVFKQALAKPPAFFISIYESPKIITPTVNENQNCSPQSLNFAKLYNLNEKFIFAFTKNGIYIFDVEKAAVLLWSNYFEDILEAKVLDNTIYLWTGSENLEKLSLLRLEDCLLQLFFKTQYQLCQQVINEFYNKKLDENNSECLELLPLVDLENFCDIKNEETNFSRFINKLKTLKNDARVEKQSGVYFVNNTHFSRQLMRGNKMPSNFFRKSREHSSLERSLPEQKSSNHHRRSRSLSECEINGKIEIAEEISETNFSDKSRANNFNSEILTMDKLLVEMSMYHTPFISLASSDILQDSLAEFGTNFTEIFNSKSKNFIEKLEILHTKLNPFTSKKNKHKPFDVTQKENFEENDFILDESPPIIDIVEKKKNDLPEIDCCDIIKICKEIRSKYELQNHSNELLVDNDENLYNNNSNEIFSEKCKNSLKNHSNEIVAENYENSLKNHSNEIDLNLLDEILKQFFLYSLTESTDLKDYFPFRLYLKKEIINIAKFTFDNLFVSKLLIDWLPRSDLISDIDKPIIKSYYPELLQKIHTIDDLIIDFALRKLILIFSEIVDPYTIIDKIKILNLRCYYLTLTCILDNFQNSYIEENQILKNEEWPMPIFLNTMLLMLSLDQAETFYQMGIKRNIKFSEISYLILTIGNKNTNTNENVFLTYITKYLMSNLSSSDKIFENSWVLSHILNEMFKIDVAKYDFCDCWFPIHKIPSVLRFEEISKILISYFWKICEKLYSKNENKQSEIIEIGTKELINLKYFRENFDDGIFEYCYKNCGHKICANAFGEVKKPMNDNSEILIYSYVVICKLCWKWPYLWEYVLELQKASKFQILSIEHFIQLGMILEIEQMLIDKNSVRRILDLKLRLHDGFCLNCGFKNADLQNIEIFSWTNLFIMILKLLGPDETLIFLSELRDFPSLEKRFYASCIEACLASPFGTKAQKNAVSAICNLNEVSPVSKRIENELIEALKKDLKQCDLSVKIKSSSTHHWGGIIDMSTAICYCCSLPLNNQRILQEQNGGIMVFSCQHTYHTICLKNQGKIMICLRCKKS